MRTPPSTPVDEGMSPRKSKADDWKLHVTERTLERLRGRRGLTDDARLAA